MHNRRKLLALSLTALAGPTADAAFAQASVAPDGLGTPQFDDADSPYQLGKHIVEDIGRIVTPNGIEQTRTVRLGGMDQWISIRGANRSNPVLLFIHGGPGSPEMGISWAFQRGWEEYFTVVQWDQRGAGKTLRTNGVQASLEGLTRERIKDDAIELMGWLREHLGQEKLVILGHSFGTTVALRACLECPEWVHAYVGIGPLVNTQENERVGYELTLAAARAAGHAQAIEELEAIAPYPGPTPDIVRLGTQRKWNVYFGGLAAGRTNADFYFRAVRLSPLYDGLDRASIDRGGEISVNAIWSSLSQEDFFPVRRTRFPVVLLLGRHDYTTPSEIAARWLNALHAPAKHAVWFEHSAHLPMIEEPGRTLLALTQIVRPLTGARATQL